MFDPFTKALITSAPQLDGLDLEELPQKLTQAFAEIVSARIRFRGELGSHLSEELKVLLHKMRRVAAAQEALVALLPDNENRAAAAFVAAAAHQAFALGERIEEKSKGSYITETSVSADVCATLLFLIAEAHADAAESAKSIVVPEDASATERAVLNACIQLATGQLRLLSRVELPVIDETLSLADQAIQAFQVQFVLGLRNLAIELLRRLDVPHDKDGFKSAREVFQNVKDLSIDRVEGVLGEGDVFSLFPGPLHLANLLLATERDLSKTAITRVQTPKGVSDEGWWKIINRMSRDRPYLWRNHRNAIDMGYLERGVSSAISFPTGGGKSTLAELKIAVALLLGQKVVFLAPTNALVDQTATALKKTFEDFEVVGDIGDEVTFETLLVLPEVIVTTPERCLFLMTMQAEAFDELGLIIFDECHLLHPREDDRSRRAVDAMLSILNLTQVAPKADLVLLSAMMKNTKEMALWVEEMTERPCLSLDIGWKPTRQVRGSVVYPTGRIAELKTLLKRARLTYSKKKNGAPADIERQLIAAPVGLFCLLQTWSSNNRADYALMPLIDPAPHFTTARNKDGSWRLTPNGNKLGAALAAAAAASRVKTLVFVGSEVLAHSGAKNFKSDLPVRDVELLDEEKKLYERACEEMGGSDYCYLKLDEDGVFRGGATSHHALLLREERHLHESLFKRKGGIDALFATSTLAQGMNLPSEIVIIAGDSRFDPTADKMATLEAHELLNAAGRAGRAGENSQGFVLVIPSRVIDFDDETGNVNKHWATLQKIFGQGDQCLDIDDPFTHLLDLIHDGATDSGIPAYFLSKLPVSSGDDRDVLARNMLNRSLAAYRARAAGNERWLMSRISAALAARTKEGELAPADWLSTVSGSTGISTSLLSQVWSLLDEGKLSGSAEEITQILLTWIEEQPEYLFELMRPENIEGLFGEEYKKLKTDQDRGAYALPKIRALLSLWLSGLSLSEIEKKYLNKDEVGLCKTARHFALRIVPDISFLGGLPAQLLRSKAVHEGVDPAEIAIPNTLAVLPSIIREGCVNAESLATHLILGLNWSRPKAKEQYEKILPYISTGDPMEDFETTKQRVREAFTMFDFDQDD